MKLFTLDALILVEAKLVWFHLNLFTALSR